MKGETLRALQAARAVGSQTALVTELASGRQVLLVEGKVAAGDLDLSPTARASICVMWATRNE